MRVVEVTAHGGPEVLQVAERPDPVPGDGQVVVAVRAANVNPTDLAARMGYSPRPLPDPPYVLGWDFAGEVVSVGAGVTGVAPGDRVVGMVQWYDAEGRVGAYAERILVDAGWIVPLPASVDATTAATVPLNGLTAAQGLARLGLALGQTLLVTGASGAVGAFAVQLAVAAGLRVTAQASTGDEDWVRSLGPERVVGRDADLSELEVDAAFDAVPLGEPVHAAVRDGGAIVTTRRVPDPDPARGIRSEVFLVHHDREELRRLVGEVAAGRLRTRVDRVLPLERAADAHRLNEAGGLRGKVVLEP
ncbi:MAG: NADP-dependent oxidoreductase [Solirubrobacteraceae bacterium]|nr:NADP-dependent oxidoreductase [Solirubrobacteraceae bacterium]